MDRFGLDLFNPGTERVKTIAAPASRGYAASVVLAHDANCFIDYFGGAPARRRLGNAPVTSGGLRVTVTLPAR